MRMRVPLTALAALLLMGMHSACSRTGDPAQLATVDDMMKITDSLVDVLGAIDAAGLQRMDSMYALRKDLVTARMRDTLNKEEAIAFGNYHRAMTRTLGRALSERENLINELATLKKQLADLRHDVEKGIQEPSAVSTYISSEQMHLDKAMRGVEVVRQSAATVQREQDRSGALVDALIATDTTAAR